MSNNQISNLEDRFLTESEASKLVGFSKNTLRAWRVSGRPGSEDAPKFIKHGRSVRYRLSDLLSWMASHKSNNSTSSYSE